VQWDGVDPSQRRRSVISGKMVSHTAAITIMAGFGRIIDVEDGIV
jgi:hypothetical protein